LLGQHNSNRLTLSNYPIINRGRERKKERKWIFAYLRLLLGSSSLGLLGAANLLGTVLALLALLARDPLDLQKAMLLLKRQIPREDGIRLVVKSNNSNWTRIGQLG